MIQLLEVIQISVLCVCEREWETERESVHLGVRKREKERAIVRENKIKREKKIKQ